MSSVPAVDRLVGTAVRPQAVVVYAQTALFLLALGLPMTSAPKLDRPLPIPGSLSIYVADVVVLLAVVFWLVARLSLPVGERGAWLRTPVIGLPLAAFAALLVPGIIRGHERYGASYLGQPARLVLYAALAFAMTELRPGDVYRGIVAVFYAGAVWQAALGAYHLATGTSQTPISELSTGGVRALSLTTGMYLAGALLLAVINLELDRNNRWRAVHLAVAGLATFGIVVAFGRTTFLALILVLPFLLWRLRELRARALQLWRWWVPTGVVAVGLVLAFVPGLASTFAHRVSANPITDRSVEWRIRGIHAALTGMKSGQWRPADVATVLNPNVNHLPNGDFETGTKGWLVQGGRISTIDSANPFFGRHSLELVTRGRKVDEGLYSTPVIATRGQTWTFSIWLKGTRGGERVNVAIWQYDNSEGGTGQIDFPVTLSLTPTQYFVTTTIKDSHTTHIRALVRTADRAQAITVYGDTAKLRGKVLAELGPNRGIYPYTFTGGGVVPPRIAPNGVWEPVDGAEFGQAGPNLLTNEGFEQGTAGWSAQGSQIGIIPSNNPAFGASTLEVKTNGDGEDEGVYSEAVPAHAGQTWTFSIWLKGTHGGEITDVSVWEYGADGAGTGQANYPVTLSISPTQYSVTTSVISPDTTQIRAVLRTRARQPLDFYADVANLELRSAPSAPGATSSASVAKPPRSSFDIREPLLGLGFGRTVSYVWHGRFYRVAGDPDNSYVFILAGGGALALAAFLFLLGAYVRDAWRRLRASRGRDNALVAWALATWFVFAVNAAMAPFFPRPKILLAFWALLLLPALVRGAREERAAEPSRATRPSR